MIDEMDSYRFHDVYLLQDAAALICGIKPSTVASSESGPYIPIGCDHDESPNGVYQGVLKGLVHAVRCGKLPAAEQHAERDYYPLDTDFCDGSTDYTGTVDEIDPSSTMVSRDDLIVWLDSRNYRPSFFFPDAERTPDYLDPEHPRYSAKLAAAVKVWQVMEDENLRSGKSERGAMEAWLTSHYLELGLLWENKINNTGIKEVAKVANWNDGGGAPKTPRRK